MAGHDSDEEVQVSRHFGDLRYLWRIEGLPQGTPQKTSDYLWRTFQDHKDLPRERWPVKRAAMAAAAVELSVHFANVGQPIPVSLLRLLAGLMDTSDMFLVDPMLVYEGTDRSPEPSRQIRAIAEAFNLEAVAATGEELSLVTLNKRINDIKHTPYADRRKMIGAWLKDPEHRDHVEFLRSSRELQGSGRADPKLREKFVNDAAAWKAGK